MLTIHKQFPPNSSSVFLIAEIGKNFIQDEEEKDLEHYIDNAKKLIKAAKDSGASAVKFQTHVLEDEFMKLEIPVTSPHFKNSDRYKWIARNERITPIEFWQEIKKYSDELGILFFTTPMSRGSAQKIESLVPMWKVGSGDILDFVMLDYIASTGKPIILSTGMSTLEEIDKVVEFLKNRTDQLFLMHCVSKYPASEEDLNLGTIAFLRERYNLPVGFSDHSIGYDSAVMAYNLGARIIEKHFSFNRDFWGSDHKVSMTPEEFFKMSDLIKSGARIETKNYGLKNKTMLKDEAVFRPVFRKTLVAGRDLKKGEIIKKEDIYAMRPQGLLNGIPSENYEDVLGKEISIDLKKYNIISDNIISM